MADPTPPEPPTTWSGWAYLLLVILFGWVGDWLRSRWQRRPPDPPHNHPHRRHDDVCEECEHEHHHHRASDEDEEG